jgi:nucleoside-diphosphate-sugar epimerase
MKFVVTGGAGFIGSNIAKLLVKKGHDVIILDNFNTGRKENLELIKDKIDLHVVDIRDKKIVNEIINNSDGIFHQAALANVYESFSKSKEYFDVNVKGTKNIFEIAKENKIKVVFASSSSIYGEVKTMPITENINRKPIHPYGQTKLDCEFLAEKFSKEGLKVIGLRYFNVYGLGQNDAYAGVITKFLNKIKENKSPEIFGDGLQTRDFIFVKDVANANLSAMMSKINFEFFNIGSQKSISILELAQIIIKNSGLDLKPEFKESLQGDAKTSLADISLAIKKLQWNPTYKLEKWFEEEVFNK